MTNDGKGKGIGATCLGQVLGRRTGFAPVLLAVLFTAVAMSLWQQRVCAYGSVGEGVLAEVGLSPTNHDKLMHRVSSVADSIGSLQKQVAQLQADIRVQDKPKKKTRKVMLFTMIFGEKAANEPWLPLFVKSAGLSGVDYAIVGDQVLPLDLPDNVRHIHISYDAFCDKISEDIFDGHSLPMKGLSHYKVIDAKPLLGYLFRDIIAEYGWWGHIDNDMIMGHFPSFITPELLENYDMISGLARGDNGRDELNTWGPFMLYRNVPKATQLFRHAFDLLAVFNNYTTFFFDEWGGDQFYQYSMTSTLNAQAEKLNIRWHGGGIPLGWDGECRDKVGKRCSECILSERFYSEGRTLSTLTWNRTLFAPEEQYKVYPVLFCHFQFGKKLMHGMFDEMSPDQKQKLEVANPLIWSYLEGFHV